MLEVRPRNALSSTWEVLDDGKPAALLRRKQLKEGAELQIPGTDGPMLLDREGLASGDFQLIRDDQVVARARKPSALRSAFVLDLSGAVLHFQPDSCWHRSFTLYRQDEPIGSVTRRGFWISRVEANLPADWPLPVRIFVLWLAMVIWQRDDTAAMTG